MTKIRRLSFVFLGLAVFRLVSKPDPVLIFEQDVVSTAMTAPPSSPSSPIKHSTTPTTAPPPPTPTILKSISSLHIPKTAGGSLRKDLRFLDQNTETCLSALPFHNKGKKASDYNIAMFRSPRAHVLSQYLHCRYRDNQPDRTPQKRKKWPALPESLSGSEYPLDSRESHIQGLDAWLTHMLREDNAFETLEDSFSCYTPWNLQSRMLTCTETGVNANGAQVIVQKRRKQGPPQPKEPEWIQVEEAIRSLAFAGLTEQFAVSVCMTHWLHSKTMPESCDCRNAASVDVTHDRHNMPRAAVTLDDLPEDIMKKIDDLTKVDQKLYTLAQQLFQEQVKAVEQESAIPLLCDNKK